MVSIDTPRKRIALSLSITIVALSLAGNTAFAATKTASIKKITTASHAIKKTVAVKSPVIKKKTQVKAESTSAVQAKQLPTDEGLLTHYTVVAGDTISGIADKFSVDQGDIFDLNGLSRTAKLHIGMILSIPVNQPIAVPSSTSQSPQVNVPIITPSAQQSPAVTPVTIVSTNTTPGTPTLRGGYYAQPVTGILTQGIHDINAVDFGCPVGTDVYAAAAGTIFIAKGNNAYNGGYGNYIVINHPNSTQTLYAHLSQVDVTVGETVTQGQLIALSGITGRVTGPHVHVEVRGALNPWGDDALGTHYTALQ